MSAVDIWILLGNELLLVLAQLDDCLVEFFVGLRKNAEHNLTKDPYRDCKFYELKNPVPVVMDDNEGAGEDEQRDARKDFQDQVKQACLEETNRVLVNPFTRTVRRLAKQILGNHVHLVIDLPDPIGKLVKEHDALFKYLQVTVETLGNWHEKDVDRNLQGGILTSDSDDLPPEFRVIQEALAKKRVYQTDDKQKRNFQDARSYETLFDRVFAPGDADSCTVISGREFAAFCKILRCYHPYASRITHDSSSALKASSFIAHFIQPPFISECDNYRRFKNYRPWGFPIFVDTTSARNVWRKFTPRSDWMVISPHHKIPFVISEVISQKQEKDRTQMLVQAIALACAGNFLLQSTSKRSFFVVAIYVAANMVASRYIVMQSGRGNAEHANDLYRDKAVCIHRKDFKLDNNEEEVDFLREMYNLATQITTLSGDLDQLKENSLMDIKAAAQKVLTLSSPNPQPSTSGSTISMNSTTDGGEWSNGLQDEDGLRVFEGEDIRNVLDQMNYKIEFVPWGHPQLAVIVNKTGDKHGYLKFVEREREVDILQYLTQIESPSNHTISGVRFWPVEGGTVISMPVAGGWLTSLDKPNKQLWSVALQLVEAVAFMHEHNVAHMDIKPQNVIIPPEGGRLLIIDFNVSIRVRGPDVKHTGVVGTEDYIPPEVRKGKYKPMLADLWSCGRTLEELCLCCDSSADRTKLLWIARKLMNRDPEARPSMPTVLEWMAPKQRGKVDVVSPALGICPTVSLPCV